MKREKGLTKSRGGLKKETNGIITVMIKKTRPTTRRINRKLKKNQNQKREGGKRKKRNLQY